MSGWIASLEAFAQHMVSEYTYAGAFVMLFVCGLGVPLPEELTILGSGLLLHQGEVQYWPILVTVYCGVIAGDLIPFTCGRFYGKSALQNRFLKRLIDDRTFARLERRFREHGNWATFSCRFVPGLRWPGYFMAGTMRMPYWRWLMLDAIGAAIQVPIVLHLGRIFAENVQRLDKEVDHLNLILAFIVLALVLTIVFRSRLVRWRRHKHLRGERELTRNARSLWAATRAAQTTAARARAMAEFSPSRTTDPPTGEPKA